MLLNWDFQFFWSRHFKFLFFHLHLIVPKVGFDWIKLFVKIKITVNPSYQYDGTGHRIQFPPTGSHSLRFLRVPRGRILWYRSRELAGMPSRGVGRKLFRPWQKGNTNFAYISFDTRGKRICIPLGRRLRWHLPFEWWKAHLHPSILTPKSDHWWQSHC